MKYKKNKIFRKTFMKLFPDKKLRIHNQSKSKHFFDVKYLILNKD